MGLIGKQLKLFHVEQHDCCNCLQSFVPLSRDLIRSWDLIGFEEVPANTYNWAVDRVFQDNTRFCSTECVDAWTARSLQLHVERIQYKNRNKLR